MSCILRALTIQDLGMILDWRNSQGVRDFMLTQHEIGMEEHLAWFEKVAHEKTRYLAIAEIGQLPVGFLNFSNVDQGGVSDWGFYASPSAPPGSGSVFCRFAIDVVFQKHKAHKICGRVLHHNSRSLRLHKKLGFREEGVLRDQLRRGDRYYSLHCFGLLRSEWEENKVGLK